ncbi:hypothetical protein [Serratia phage X20]|uniref:Uncharacterized protein n=1 Tax=Serratia phage X20 TaxID=2006942 RepID=A0A1Z1LZG9_9CAUD|nr:hypothetical protein KNT72_gp146 [Serratia phage X20]ARW58241.1 hypothetical protein [Serratia phage X20]
MTKNEPIANADGTHTPVKYMVVITMASKNSKKQNRII